MRKVLFSCILCVSALFYTGCATSPQSVIDANQASLIYLTLISKDVEIVTEALTEAAKEENSKYYDYWLENVENEILYRAGSPTEALDMYKEALGNAVGEKREADTYYDNIQRDLNLEIQAKLERAKALILKIDKYNQSGHVSDEVIQEMLDTTVGIVQEFKTLDDNEKADVRDGDYSGLIDLIKENALGGILIKRLDSSNTE